jgi:hypothetical protein
MGRQRLWTAGLLAGLLLSAPRIGLSEETPAYYQAPVISTLSNEGKGWDLSDQILGEGSLYDFGGWVSFGYHSDSDGLFNQHPHNVNNHQSWVYLSKTLDSSEGFDWGGRFDAMYGIDAQDTQAFGNPPGNWDYKNDLDHGQFGWAFPQLYLELGYKDFSVKGGHFYTLLGYEVVTAPDNFFYSHAFTMYKSEAFTHTGVLGTYTGLEKFTLYGGWTAGWDTGFDRLGNGSSFLGGASYAPIEQVTLTYILTGGDLGWVGDGYTHSIVLVTQPLEKLKYVLQSDYVNTDKDVLGNGDSNYETIGVNQYLIYQLLDEIGVGARGEWWRTSGVNYGEITGGINIKPLPNLTFRPEGRYQFSDENNDDSKQVTNKNPAGLPLGDAIFGVDMIITF